MPKLAVERAQVTPEGLVGDGHHDTKHHGGVDRAVCLFAMEVIDRLRAEGHPIGPGTIGENVTVAGLEWKAVAPGRVIEFAGGVVLEVTAYTTPCSTIRESFRGLEFNRVKQEQHAGDSRVYARVVREGELRVGETVWVRVSGLESCSAAQISADLREEHPSTAGPADADTRASGPDDPVRRS
ncbi:MAG: MOSC domain-containing protein [Phycisphaeraceae bacterium]|nr:MOSC domain-containing protein [Phycisphaeraceae bacterium]